MNENLKILKTAEEIENRVREIGAELKSLIKDSQPVAVCVLSGSFIFYSDLIRTLNTDMTCEFLGVSSYKNNVVSGGEVALTLDLANPIEGKEVILIEDLVDTGLTM
jgi:hypoxanthine phosphoribosyltransferase